MKELIIYILEVNTCLLLLYFLYRVAMKSQSCFRFNRRLLLVILLFSVLVPFLPNPSAFLRGEEGGVQNELILDFGREKINTSPLLIPEKKSVPSLMDETVSHGKEGVSTEGDGFLHVGFFERVAWTDMLFVLYLSGIFITAFLFLRPFYGMKKLLRYATVIHIRGMKIFLLPGKVSSWSIGRYIVLSEEDWQDGKSEILLHEEAHYRQGHVYDLLLLSLFEIIFWFNPLLKMYRRDLNEVHEYLADHRVLEQGVDSFQYQMLIIRKSNANPVTGLATSFRSSYNQIKNRIFMMNREKKNSSKQWYALLFLPLAAVLLMSFGSRSEASYQAAANGLPEGWIMTGSAPKDYQVSVLPEKREGNNVVLLESVANPDPSKFGTLSQYCSADQYLGKRVRMTGYLKSENVKNWAGMWFRVDDSRQKDVLLSFDNMSDRPIKNTTDWKKYEIVLDVPQEAGAMAFGVMLEGSGKVWISDISFEVVDQSVPTTNMVKERAQLPQGPVNLDFAE